jgi:hypothetical protein
MKPAQYTRGMATTPRKGPDPVPTSPNPADEPDTPSRPAYTPPAALEQTGPRFTTGERVSGIAMIGLGLAVIFIGLDLATGGRLVDTMKGRPDA